MKENWLNVLHWNIHFAYFHMHPPISGELFLLVTSNMCCCCCVFYLKYLLCDFFHWFCSFFLCRVTLSLFILLSMLMFEWPVVAFATHTHTQSERKKSDLIFVAAVLLGKIEFALISHRWNWMNAYPFYVNGECFWHTSIWPKEYQNASEPVHFDMLMSLCACLSFDRWKNINTKHRSIYVIYHFIRLFSWIFCIAVNHIDFPFAFDLGIFFLCVYFSNVHINELKM